MSSTKTVPIVNPDFVELINWGSEVMPKISKFGVLGVYVISAIIMGSFHITEIQNTEKNIPGLVAFMPLIADAGVQFIRAICVFFSLNSPIFIAENKRTTRAVAFLLMALSCYDAYVLMIPHSVSFTITVISLMLGGFVVEIGLLKEIERTVIYLIMQDQDFEKNLTTYYQGLEKVKHIKTTAKRTIFNADGSISGYKSGNLFKRSFQGRSSLNSN